MRTTGKSRLTILLISILILSFGVMYLNGTFATSYERQGNEKKLSTVEGYADKDYNVAVVHKTSSDSQGISLMDNTTNLFGGVLWCPGRTEILYLEVTNKEAFPLACHLTMNSTAVDNNSENKLGNVFSYAVIEDLSVGASDLPANWDAFYNTASTKGALNSDKPTVFNINSLSPTNTKSYALAIHMDENASSDYQNLSMNLSFNLYVEANYKPAETPASPTK